VDRGDDTERPVTTRIGPAGGSGRGLRTAVVLVAVALAVAVVKPWDWIGAPPRAPGREGAAIPVPSPTVAPTPAPRDWTGVGTRIACLSGGSWLAVVDQVDGPTVARSWTRLDPVPATGPTDPAIVRMHVYAASVPRLGFCAPTPAPAPGASGAGPAADDAFRVRAWQLQPAPGADGPPEAVEIALAAISGGSADDQGVLYGPPGSHPRPRARLPAATAWPIGTYVFRAQQPGAGPSDSSVAWFIVELRGPWMGPAASLGPEPTP
jgi:hypothetical protein